MSGQALSLNSLRRWISDIRHSQDLRRKRLSAMLNGVLSSLGNRLLSVVIGLVSVPLTIHYLGTELYGAWLAINAILAWLGLTDLGLGLGLTNAVTSDASRDRPERVRMHVSNFLVLMSLLSLVAAVLIGAAWPLIDWSSLLGVGNPAARPQVELAIALAGLISLARMPLAVANRVYIAYQEGYIGNAWGAAGNILSLLGLILVTRTEGGLPWLVLAVAGLPFLVELANTFWLFLRHRPALRPGLRHVDRTGFGEIMKIGYQFFLIQIMALVTFQTDVLVIAHFLGSSTVPHYNLTYQLFNYATLPQAMLFPYLWAAYNEAITRGDIDWVARTLRWTILAGLLWAIAAGAALVVIAKPFIGWWAGPQVVPGSLLVLLMAVWLVVNLYTNFIACLLAAASRVKYQLGYSALSTLCNLILSILLVRRFGPEGVIASTLISYLIFVCGPTSVDVLALLRRLRRTAAQRPLDAPPASAGG